MTEVEIKNNKKSYSILDLLQDEVDTIKNNLPKRYDNRARFLAIIYPVVEVVLMICGDWTDEVEKTGRGRKPFPHTALMLINILAKMLNVSYRQVIRELKEHPTWLKALKLKKAPSHNKLSEFRTEMGASFFKNCFYKIRDILFDLNLIEGEGAIADSAPISASMNFAKANTKPKINEARVKEFFVGIDISPAINRLKITRKSKYPPEAIIKFLIFECVCGFLSRAQALRFLKEFPSLAELLGFINGKIPSQATISYFLKKHGSVSKLLKPIIDTVAEFFKCSDSMPADSDINFFFWSI